MTHQVHSGGSVTQGHADPGGRVSDDLPSHLSLGALTVRSVREFSKLGLSQVAGRVFPSRLFRRLFSCSFSVYDAPMSGKELHVTEDGGSFLSQYFGESWSHRHTNSPVILPPSSLKYSRKAAIQY